MTNLIILVCNCQYLVLESKRDKTHTNMRVNNAVVGCVPDEGTRVGFRVSQTNSYSEREKRHRGFVVETRWTM